MAKAFGLKVIGTAGSEAGISVAKLCGANATFNHKDDHYVEKIVVKQIKADF